MRSRARALIAAIIVLCLPAVAAAQEPRIRLAARAGVVSEHSEDNLKGTMPALGLLAAVVLTRDWRGEFEFWLPGYIKDSRGEPKHRDVLFSLSAVRLFHAGRTRPFVAAGFTLSRTEDWFTFCTARREPPGGGSMQPTMVSCDAPDVIDIRREKNAGMDGYLLTGGGIEIPLHPRVDLVAEVRVNLAPASVLVRPGAGIAVRF
jgi:hypothetical protein